VDWSHSSGSFFLGATSDIFVMPTAPRSQFESIVVSNASLCREHYRLTLALRDFPATEPGQFVQISCRPIDDGDELERELDWPDGRMPVASGVELRQPMAMLRRPFSLAGRRDVAGGVEIDIIHRVVGIGTDWLSRLEPGDSVHLLGPLGNRFALPAPGGAAVLVGGGVGIPPMLYLAERLANRPAVAFCGALSRDLLPFTLLDVADSSSNEEIRPAMIVGEFARHGIPSVLSTDDGSIGFRGFVTQALERYLDANGTNHPVIYTCGPEPMMKRVAEIAAARGLACQIAVERAMACGMGTCQSCVIRVRRPATAGRDWAYRLACTDGPIFGGDELLW
jgi:dihydroorotate dehydrogenase electron transfer subunit